MSIDKIRLDLANRLEDVNQEPPNACIGCPNLNSTSLETGRVVLSCMLERADSQMTGPRDKLAENGATAKWIARALTADDLSAPTGEDRGAVDFRNKADAANDYCPVIEKVLAQLPSSMPSQLIDLSPPHPVLEFRDLRVAIGLDPVRQS